METLLLLKPSPLLQFPTNHHLRSRRRASSIGLRRRTPRCALGDPFLSDPLLLAAAAAAAAATISALRVVYASNVHDRQRDGATEGSNTDMSQNTFQKGDGDLVHSYVDSEFNLLRVANDGTACIAAATYEEIDSSNNEPFDVRDGKVPEFQKGLNLIPISHVAHSHLSEYREPSSTTENIEEEITREILSACHPKTLLDIRNVELDIIKELLLGNQGEGEISVFSNLINQYSRISIVPDVLQVIGGDPIVEEAAVGKHHSMTSIGFLKHPVKSSSRMNQDNPTSDLRHLNQISRQFSLQNKVGFNSLARSSSASPKEVVRSSSKKSFPARGKETNSSKSSRDMTKSRIPHRESRGRNSSPPNEMIAKDANHVSFALSRYNRLLREARLNECIDLLESMEMNGILDMEKVYHTKFLKTCKAQKAVKEAFRFTKLIKNPTLSTFNMLLSVCASSQSYEGAFQVLLLVKDAGLRPDCQLYTTLISTCGKSGKVDAMFEVFHEMVNAGVEPNLHTYGALIDGCARAGQVAKAFGAYGIMRSKNVKPDRVIFNALITACGQSGAMDRAFDVLAEMRAEPQPIDPDHVTIGALIKTCTQAGQSDRAREVYQMLHKYKIKGTADVYTIAVNSCSLTGNLEFALSIYDDMRKNGIVPDEMFLSTIIDVAGHAGKVDIAFEILKDAKLRGLQTGIVTYSSLMGACSKAKNWLKALDVHEEIKSLKLQSTSATMNALITSLCNGSQLPKAVEILHEMREAGVHPNVVTYSILIVACEKKNEVELGFDLLSQAKKDGILPNLLMCQCLTGLCVKRYERACALGEPILSFNSGRPQIDSKWMKWGLVVYREIITAGLIPSSEVFSQVLGCLKFPNDIPLRKRFVENLGIALDSPRHSNLSSLLDGFGEYDPRAFSICEEASSLGIVPCISFKDGPIVVDARKLQNHMAEVYILTILKGLKHRLAAGAKLPNMTILLPVEKTQISLHGGEKNINLSGRVGRAVTALLRRLGLTYQGDESYGKIRINGLTLRRWFKPKIAFQSFGAKPADLTPSQSRLAKEIASQQRSIRSSYNISIP